MAFPVNIQDPDEIDPTSDTAIYMGWKIVGTSNYKIQKAIVNSDETISMRYAIGAWADRTTLTYE